MLENLWKGGDNDRATVDWRWKSTQREVFDRCSRDSSPFSSLVPSFFFPPPFFPTTTTTGSSRGRRNIFFRGYGCAPTRGMRRGSSVESFLMTERNDSSNLMEEGRTTTPSNFSRRTFLTSWLISPPTHTHMDFFFNVIDRPIELVKILWGIVLEGVGEGARKERTRMCFVIAWSLDGTRIVLSEDEIDWRKWITFLFYWLIRVCDLFFYALLIFLYKNRSCRKKKKKKLKFLCVLMLY